MKKQHLIIILLFSFLLAVPAVQAQKKVLPAELEVELKYGADRLGKRQDPGGYMPFPAVNGTIKHTTALPNG
jgi:hypothetical protein